jgi:hypothetical protein
MAGDLTVLGLPLDIEDGERLQGLTPLSALVVVKALNDQAQVCYVSAAAGGLTSVEALGMADAVTAKLRDAAAEDLG